MNVKRYMLGSIAVWVFIFLYEFLFHSMALDSMYMQIIEMKRPEAEFFAHFHWIVIGEGLMAFFFSYIFVKGYEGKGIMEGVRFGLLVGLAFGVSTSLIWYAVYKLPGNLVGAWVVGIPVEMILAGVVIAAIYEPTA